MTTLARDLLLKRTFRRQSGWPKRRTCNIERFKKGDLDDDRDKVAGRWRGQLPSGDVVAEVRQALIMNEARKEAIASSLSELRTGVVPEGWPSAEFTPELIRHRLRRAEALLREQVGLIRENGAVIGFDLPDKVEITLGELEWDALRGAVIEQTLRRINASWCYIDVIAWSPLILPNETPVLYLITLPLGQPHKKRQLLGEEHNLSGVHFHYAKLDGKRSNILFAFGHTPPDHRYPVSWERHGTNKAKFFPKPEAWNFAKRENVNAVCCAARDEMHQDTRYFVPSKEAQFLLPT